MQPLGQVTKKKTTEKALVDGAADISESMFFNLPKSRAVVSHCHAKFGGTLTFHLIIENSSEIEHCLCN